MLGVILIYAASVFLIEDSSRVCAQEFDDLNHCIGFRVRISMVASFSEELGRASTIREA
jgi:hypothetical protein